MSHRFTPQKNKQFTIYNCSTSRFWESDSEDLRFKVEKSCQGESIPSRKNQSLESFHWRSCNFELLRSRSNIQTKVEFWCFLQILGLNCWNPLPSFTHQLVPKFRHQQDEFIEKSDASSSGELSTCSPRPSARAGRASWRGIVTLCCGRWIGILDICYGL